MSHPGQLHNFKSYPPFLASTFERQVTELHVRVALLNRFTQLGSTDDGACGFCGVAAFGAVGLYGPDWFFARKPIQS